MSADPRWDGSLGYYKTQESWRFIFPNDEHNRPRVEGKSSGRTAVAREWEN